VHWPCPLETSLTCDISVLCDIFTTLTSATRHNTPTEVKHNYTQDVHWPTLALSCTIRSSNPVRSLTSQAAKRCHFVQCCQLDKESVVANLRLDEIIKIYFTSKFHHVFRRIHELQAQSTSHFYCSSIVLGTFQYAKLWWSTWTKFTADWHSQGVNWHQLRRSMKQQTKIRQWIQAGTANY